MNFNLQKIAKTQNKIIINDSKAISEKEAVIFIYKNKYIELMMRVLNIH